MYIEPEELDNRQKDSLCRIINYTGVLLFQNEEIQIEKP